MGAKKLYFLRHGETGLPGRYIGATDVPLTAKGMDQVRKTRRMLQGENISRILCSPLLRCRQTMDILDLSVPCQFDERLKEIDFGRWEGKTFAEIQLLDQRLVDIWVSDPDRFTFPGGESMRSFQDRVAMIKTSLAAMAEDTVLVVTHGGIIRYLLCLLLGFHSEKYLVFDAQPGCFSSVRLFPEGGVLTGFNITG